jgi:hypothetical protein
MHPNVAFFAALALLVPLAGCPSAEAAPDDRPPPMSNLTPEQRRTYDEYRALAVRNDCSSGFQRLSGTWRFVGESRMPEYQSELQIDGSRYTETLSGREGKRRVSGRIDGEIRCLFKNRVLVSLDRVTPEGAFDNRSGEAYPCDLLGDMDPTTERMLMICYFDWDLRPAAGREFEYERVE